MLSSLMKALELCRHRRLLMKEEAHSESDSLSPFPDTFAHRCRWAGTLRLPRKRQCSLRSTAGAAPMRRYSGRSAAGTLPRRRGRSCHGCVPARIVRSHQNLPGFGGRTSAMSASGYVACRGQSVLPIGFQRRMEGNQRSRLGSLNPVRPVQSHPSSDLRSRHTQ